MTSFNELFETLKSRAQEKPEGSRTVELLELGRHSIGKKIVEEASEVWMAAEHEGKQRTVEEISQLLYHVQVLMVEMGISIEDLEGEL
jgi:phosphoribosyl-ATP pyrophosphohydrolase